MEMISGFNLTQSSLLVLEIDASVEPSFHHHHHNHHHHHDFHNGTSPLSRLPSPAAISDDEEDIVEETPLSVQIIIALMYVTISLAAIGGNGIVIYIVLAYQRMRTVTNLFIVNLAVGDILMACLCIPFTFVSNLMLQYWPFGVIMCVLVSYAQAVSVFISAYTLVAISIDRYIAILYPLRPRMTKLQATLIIITTWAWALITPLPTAILSTLVQTTNYTENNKYTCTEDWPSAEQRYVYSMILMVLQYAFPCGVLIYTYLRIGIVVWGKRPPGEAEGGRDARMAASKRKVKPKIEETFGGK